MNRRLESEQSSDADKLKEKMKQQFEIAAAIDRCRDPLELMKLRKQLKAKRDECIEIVDRYFRLSLKPQLESQCDKVSADSNVARFTEMLNDFFVEVIQSDKSQFWQETSPKALRSYVATALSRDAIDIIRRRKKIRELAEDDLNVAYNKMVVEEFESNCLNEQMDSSEVSEAIARWQNSDEPELAESARLLEMRYACGSSVEEIAKDLNCSEATAYRRLEAAKDRIRAAFQTAKT